MTANRQLLGLALCVLLVLSVAAPAVAQTDEETPTPADTPTDTATPTETQTPTSTPTQTQTPTAEPGNPDIVDGVVQRCTRISEPGRYELDGDIEHDGSDVCIEIDAADVRIDGNGHTLAGDRDDSIGIATIGDYKDGEVHLQDLTLRHWGETAVDNRVNPMVIEDVDFETNTQAYEGTEAPGVEMQSVEISDTYSTAIDGQRMGEVRLHEVSVVDGGGSGLGTIDGADIRITGSEFRNNDGDGLNMGHSTTAEISDTEIVGNGRDGVFAASTAHLAEFAIEDSTIRENGRHGVNGEVLRTDRASLTVSSTRIDDNRGTAIHAYTEESPDGAEVITASDVDLGGGLAVSFEDRYVTVGTHGADDFQTDALNVSGAADAAVTGEFTTGGDRSSLWTETDDGWQQQGSYDGGAFTEAVGPGTWAATGTSESTPTAPPERSNAGTDSATRTPGSTPGADAGPSNPDGPGADSDDPDTPTGAPEPNAGGGSGSADDPIRTDAPDGTTDGTAASTDVGTEADPTDEGGTTGTPDDGTGSDPADTGTDGEEGTADSGTAGDDGVSMDGPGFGPLAALVAVAAASLLARRRS